MIPTPSVTSLLKKIVPAYLCRAAFLPAMAVSIGCVLLGFCTGCESSASGVPMTGAEIATQNATAKNTEVLKIREGDVVKIAFPGAPNLDSTQPVRRDGRITLSVVGEVVAAGLAPSELEKQLSELYASQLTSKEVTVTVLSSAFSVFVNGAVLRPGKITSDRPISALEAIMEAGGFNDTKANMRAVTVIRNEDGRTKNYTLDLKLVLEGKQSEPFYLKASDIVYVPEKFSWY